MEQIFRRESVRARILENPLGPIPFDGHHSAGRVSPHQGRRATPEDNDQIIAATYLRYLPTEAQLQGRAAARTRADRAPAPAVRTPARPTRPT